MDQVTNQQYVEIQPIPLHNGGPVNDQIDNINNSLVALQPKTYYIMLYNQFHKQTH